MSSRPRSLDFAGSARFARDDSASPFSVRTAPNIARPRVRSAGAGRALALPLSNLVPGADDRIFV